MKDKKIIKVHTLSPKHGYYIDSIEWTSENHDYIKNSLDALTGCIYTMIVYKDGKSERLTVTRELFEMAKKDFDKI